MRNKAPWVYDVLNFLEDVCEESGQKAWNAKQATNHLLITMETWDYLCTGLEEYMELLMYPYDDH